MVRAANANRTGVDVRERLSVADDRRDIEQCLLHHPAGHDLRHCAGNCAHRRSDRDRHTGRGCRAGARGRHRLCRDEIVLTTAAFEFSKPRQWTWGVIDASYHVLGILIAAVIRGCWR